MTDAPLQRLAECKSQRSFVERSIQNAKSELGGDDFRAIKYRAWEHLLALKILAAWFVVETRLEWERDMPADPAAVVIGCDIVELLSIFALNRRAVCRNL